MPESRQYELVYVIAPDVDDDGVAALHTLVEEIVVAGEGAIEKTDNWGRRRLAYEINRFKEGTYVLELFRGPGELVGELDRRLKVTDSVLRYLIVRVDEDLRKAERARTKRQETRQRRREAKGVVAPAPAPSDVAPSSATTAEASVTSATPVAPAAPEAEVSNEG